MMETREEAIAEINAALAALDHLKHRASCQSERTRYAEPVEAFLRGLLDHITVAAPPAEPYPDPPLIVRPRLNCKFPETCAQSWQCENWLRTKVDCETAGEPPADPPATDDQEL